MIKAKVQMYGVQPEMVFAHIEIKDRFTKKKIACIPTSVVGKKHSTYSLHLPGYAIDYRTKHIKGEDRIKKIKLLIKDLKFNIPQCDFVFEHEGEQQEHIHAEFDPKDDPAFQHAKVLYRLTKPPIWPRES